MDARNNIATDLFYKIRSRFRGLKLGAETGQITINPEEARFFDFDYMEGETPIGHVSVSLAEPNSMKVYFSHGITEGMDDKQKGNWYGFLKELRQFAKRRLLSFDTRDIAKDNLDKRDYEFLVKNAQPKQTQQNTIQRPVGESVMNESSMYGSRLMSYQNLMDTKLIIKHSQAVMDDTQPGARTRHIAALFVENQDGERFKYPFIHLAGARAMQRHVANGGLPYDDIGKSIIRISEEIAQLKSFSNYVVRNDLMNSDTNTVVEQSSAYLNKLREQIKALSKQSHYEAYRENFQAYDSEEVPQDVVEDFKEKFTVRSFREDIATVFPVLYRLMKEGNTIGYDDIVAMTQEDIANEDVEIEKEKFDPFAKFENWVMGLGEESAVTSEDPEEQQAAIQKLQELVGQEFPAGVDGTNAIESLKGIIEDPELYKRIKELAAQDANADVREQVQGWLQLNAPEALEQLDFGDFAPAEQNIEDPMAYANAAADADAEYYGQAGAEQVPQESIEEAPERQKKPRYKWQMGPSAREFGSPDIHITDPESGKVIVNPEWLEWRKGEKAKEYDTARDANTKSQQAAQIKHSGVDPKNFDIVTEIDNPFFDPTGPDDEDDPNFEPQEISVGISYDGHEEGEYRSSTWGYHGGDPEEFAEYVIDDYTVIDLESGEDITDHVDDDYIRELIEKDADYDPYSTSRSRYERDREPDDYDEGTDLKQMQEKKSMNVKELAEFINSFYDKESGTFPKGPEGVCTMVGKKFGEQAEQVARKFVERMAPEQNTHQNPELAELARIKELSGMR